MVFILEDNIVLLGFFQRWDAKATSSYLGLRQSGYRVDDQNTRGSASRIQSSFGGMIGGACRQCVDKEVGEHSWDCIVGRDLANSCSH